MPNYANAKATIAANIYTNHLGQVTAEMVKTAADAIVDTLIAGGYLYAGVAHPGDPAVSPDANVFYIATEAGTYTNKGDLVVADGEVAVLKYNGQWSKETTGAATAKGQYCVNIGIVTNQPSKNDWTLATAIAAIPNALKKPGMILSFRSGNYKYENWQYVLGSAVEPYFSNTDYWKPIVDIVNNLTSGGTGAALSAEMGKKLSFGANVCNLNIATNQPTKSDWTLATAIAAVPDEYKRVGIIITFRTGGYKYESWQYVVGDASAKYFSNTDYWKQIGGDLRQVVYKTKVELGYVQESGDGRIYSNIAEQTNRWNCCTPNYIKVRSAYNNTISVNCGSSNKFFICFFDKDKTFIRSSYHATGDWSANNASVAVENGTEYIKIVVRKTDNGQMPIMQEISITFKTNEIAENFESYNTKLGTYPNNTANLINIESYLHLSNPQCCDGDTTSIQDDDNAIYTNYGILRLPDTYTDNGAPTPLIVWCHGYGQHYTYNSTQIAQTSSLNISYFLKEGYAVMDIDGNPKSSTFGHACSDMAIECYVNGLNWVQKRYNVTKEVYLAGHSQGGMMALVLAELGETFPIKAVAALAPANSAIHLMELVADVSGAKDAIADYYGLSGTRPTWSTSKTTITQDEKDFFFAGDNKYKLAKTSLLWKNLTDGAFTDIADLDNMFMLAPESADTYYYQDKHKIVTKPCKIFHGTSDTDCLVGWTRLFVAMAKNTGARIEYHEFSGVGHTGIVTTGNNTITTIFGEEVTGVPTSLAEVVKFFRRY